MIDLKTCTVLQETMLALLDDGFIAIAKLAGEKRTGRPLTTVTSRNIQLVDDIIRGDCLVKDGKDESRQDVKDITEIVEQFYGNLSICQAPATKLQNVMSAESE
ncbi:hypothetical protein Trydic_g23787 [Trypoxylus dichotomus]